MLTFTNSNRKYTEVCYSFPLEFTVFIFCCFKMKCLSGEQLSQRSYKQKDSCIPSIVHPTKMKKQPPCSGLFCRPWGYKSEQNSPGAGPHRVSHLQARTSTCGNHVSTRHSCLTYSVEERRVRCWEGAPGCGWALSPAGQPSLGAQGTPHSCACRS